MNSAAFPAEAVIDVRNLRKRFGARTVVDGLTLQVAHGEICGFLGANGSGKTTTIRLLCGLLVPDEGSGTCLGHNIRTDAPAIRRQAGYMTQKFSFYEDLTVRENLQLVADVYEMPDVRGAVDAIMQRMDLTGRARQLAGQLSGGWKQRLALAACLVHQPRLLFLDEPTAGVDPKARREFWEVIHDMAGEGLTVLVSTHYMDEAERCQRVVYLQGGRIVVQGSADEVVAQSGLVVLAVTGARIDQAARALRTAPGVEATAAFGHVLHLAGSDRNRLVAAVAGFEGGALEWREIKPHLEDVFIHMLSRTETSP